MTEYIKRDLEAELVKYLNIPQVIAILGPRRSGKTTLLWHLAENLQQARYFSFEDQKILELFDRDISNFVKIHLQDSRYLILDEFHYSRFGGKQLKYLFDFHPDLKILVSGSSAMELTIRSLKALVGRVVTFELLPFNFGEYLRYRDKEYSRVYEGQRGQDENLEVSLPVNERFNELLDEYLLYGGYPEVIGQNDFEIKRKLLDQIYSLYFLKEVREVLGLMEDYALKLLLKAVSLQIGNLCQYAELAGTTGLSEPTVKKYLGYFEKTFVAFLLRPWFRNKRTELVKNPKVYFFDLGLRNAVIDNFTAIANRTDQGALLENFAAIQLRRQGELHYWRTKSKQEVDFVLESQGRLKAIEVKTRADKRIPGGLQKLLEIYPEVTGWVYGREVTGRGSDTKVLQYPVYLA